MTSVTVNAPKIVDLNASVRTLWGVTASGRINSFDNNGDRISITIGTMPSEFISTKLGNDRNVRHVALACPNPIERAALYSYRGGESHPLRDDSYWISLADLLRKNGVKVSFLGDIQTLKQANELERKKRAIENGPDPTCITKKVVIRAIETELNYLMLVRRRIAMLEKLMSLKNPPDAVVMEQPTADVLLARGHLNAGNYFSETNDRIHLQSTRDKFSSLIEIGQKPVSYNDIAYNLAVHIGRNTFKGWRKLDSRNNAAVALAEKATRGYTALKTGRLMPWRTPTWIGTIEADMDKGNRVPKFGVVELFPDSINPVQSSGNVQKRRFVGTFESIFGTGTFKGTSAFEEINFEVTYSSNARHAGAPKKVRYGGIVQSGGLLITGYAYYSVNRYDVRATLEDDEFGALFQIRAFEPDKYAQMLRQ